MSTENDTKADAMIAALVPKLMESLKGDMTKLVEDQMKPLLDNHTRLQDTLGDLKRDDDALTKLAAQVHELSGKPKDQPSAVFITRDQTRDARTYQAKKKLADEAGVPMIRVEAEGETDGKTVYTPG